MLKSFLVFVFVSVTGSVSLSLSVYLSLGVISSGGTNLSPPLPPHMTQMTCKRMQSMGHALASFCENYREDTPGEPTG